MKKETKYKKVDNSIYDAITEKDVPQTEDFEKEFNANKQFSMDIYEFYLNDKFSDDHHKCRVLPNGLSRFGTIGGGYEKKWYINPDGTVEVIGRCMGCDESMNFTAESKKLSDKEKEEIDSDEKLKKEYKIYNGCDLSRVEYLRYKKFVEMHWGHRLSIGFMGTGLGWCIDIFDEDTKEYADLTDNSCW